MKTLGLSADIQGIQRSASGDFSACTRPDRTGSSSHRKGTWSGVPKTWHGQTEEVFPEHPVYSCMCHPVSPSKVKKLQRKPGEHRPQSTCKAHLGPGASSIGWTRLTQRLECSSFSGSLIPKKKIGHNQKGTALEPLGNPFLSWGVVSSGFYSQRPKAQGFVPLAKSATAAQLEKPNNVGVALA